MREKVSENFFLDEFLDPETYQKRDYSIDVKLIGIAQFIRENTGPVTINNWFNKGSYKESGTRRPESKTGAKKSAHKPNDQGVCRAIDVKVKGMTGPGMFEWAKANKDKLYFLGVRSIEHPSLTPSWLHLSTRGEEGKIIIVDLTKVVETWRF